MATRASPLASGPHAPLSRLIRGLTFRQVMVLTTGCFILVAAGVVTVAMVSRNYSKQGMRQTETLTGNFLPGLVTLARLQDSTLNLKSLTFQLALARDEAAIAEQKRAFADYTTQVDRGVRQLTTMAQDGRIVELTAGLDAGVQSFLSGTEKFQAQLGAGEFEQAMATLDLVIVPA
ncbi:MAG TPA: hypothetical protein VEA63_07220, partial [Opitutus sp.]|nr:hypothetical protein [Opitutus sp.]